MIAASSCSVRVRSAHNKLISLWLFVLISIYSSGCSAFGAYYEIDAETENTGWAMSILKEVKFRNRGRKIYRYSNDNVSFVVCGYQDVWKTFSVGPPLLPFIPRHYKEKTKNLVVYLTVENPGVELKINFKGIRVEAPEGQTHQYGYADFCVTQTDNDENYCYCFTPEGFYRRQDGSEMELSERLDKSDTLRKPVEKGAVTVPGGSMLYTLIFHGLGIPEEFTIVFGDISVDGKSLTLEPLKFRKKFKKFHYVPISRYG